jgi:hypothetical protein
VVQSALEALSNIDPGDVLVTKPDATHWTIEFRQQYAQVNVPSVTIDATLLTGGTTPSITVTTTTAGGAPSVLALIPVLPTQCKVFLDDTYAGIGTTQLLNVLSVEYSIGKRFDHYWPLNSLLGTGPGGTLEDVPDMKVTITMANDADAKALVASMRNGATKFLRTAATGPIADGSTPYSMRIDMALNISDFNGYSEEGVVYAAGFQFMAINDPTWGQSNEISVVNLLTALIAPPLFAKRVAVRPWPGGPNYRTMGGKTMPDITDLIRREVPALMKYRPDLYGDDGFIVHFKYRPEVIDASFIEKMSARSAMSEGDGTSTEERAAMSASVRAKQDADKTADAFDANMELIAQLVSEWDLTSEGVVLPIEAHAVRQARVPVALLNNILLTVLESINAPKNGVSSPTGSSTAPASAPASTSTSEPPASLVARQRRGA